MPKANLVLLTLLSTFPLLLASCASMEVQDREPQSAAAVRIEMSIKAALLDADDVAAAPVRVEYEEGTVRLGGFVESEAERQRVVKVVRQVVPDGSTIVNELAVWSP